MINEPPAGVRWQALLVGVASNAHSENPGFVQSLNSQAEFALALERNMPGLDDDDLIVLPEPRYAAEVTEAIALLNEAHDNDGETGLVLPGLLFYYCGHGMDADGQLYFSMVETIDNDQSRRRTGLALTDVLENLDATVFNRPRVVLILDCCFAGLACKQIAKQHKRLAKRTHLLMAVGPDVLATHDPSGTGPTHFTGALVELLYEGERGVGSWIDLDTAYRVLKPRLVSRYGEDREPYHHDPFDGRDAIVLGRNRAYSGPS